MSELTLKEAIVNHYAKAYRAEFSGPLDREWSGTAFADLSRDDQKTFEGGWDEFHAMVSESLK